MYIMDIRYKGKPVESLFFRWHVNGEFVFQIDNSKKCHDEQAIIAIDGVDYPAINLFRKLVAEIDNIYNACSCIIGESEHRVQVVIPTSIDFEFRKCISIVPIHGKCSFSSRRLYVRDICDIFMMYDDIYYPTKMIYIFWSIEGSNWDSLYVNTEDTERYLISVKDKDLYNSLMARYKVLKG